MKKFVKSLYAVAIAALVLASCSKDAGNDVSGGSAAGSEVRFGSNIVAPKATRVNLAGWTEGDQVGIYMKHTGMGLDEADAILKDANNRQFQVTPATGKLVPMTADQAMFYPTAENTNVDFVAYYPFVAEEDMNLDVDAVIDYTFAVDITDGTPLLYSTIEDQVPTTDAQQFVFKHQYARIKFNVTEGEGMEDIDLGDFEVTMTNVNANATFSLLTGEFSDITTSDEVLFFTSEDGTVDSLMVIPNATDGTDRQFIFTLKDDNDIAISKLIYNVPDDKLYSAGKEYIYNVEVNLREIKVEIVGDGMDWNPGDIIGGSEVTVLEKRLLPFLEDPNSYVMATAAQTLEIPVGKAYAVWKFDERLNNYLGGGSLADNPGIRSFAKQWADNNLYFNDANVTFELVGEDHDAKIVITNLSGALPEGNFVVSLDIDGTPYWSWHVWVTDADFDAGAYTYNNGKENFTFMDRNLGAFNATAGDPGSKGLLYQWGRKDPFAGSADWTNTPATVYDGSGSAIIGYPTPYAGPVTQASAIWNPGEIVTSEDGQPWASDFEATDWGTGGEKSPFDPCPDGWRVPDFSFVSNESHSPWYKDGATYNDVTSWGLTAGNFAYGWDFDNASYQHGWYPAAGYYANTGALSMVGTTGAYWSAWHTASYTGQFSFVSTEIHANDLVNPTLSQALSIRCVKVAE